MKRPLFWKDPETGHAIPGAEPRFRDGFISAKSYVLQPTDIVVMTYPKCGTTWMQNILYLLKHGGEPFPSDKRFADLVPFIDFCGAETLIGIELPVIMKTHQCFKTMAYNPETRFICVVRNPKDCVVSFFHHIVGFPQLYGYETDSEGIFESFIEGDFESGDYFDHLLSLYEMRDKPNVFFVTYEQLLENTRDYIEKVAKFIEPLLPPNSITSEVIEKTLQNSSFDVMKVTNSDKWVGTPRDTNVASPFIRSGKAGSWKEELTPEQSARIDEKLHQKLDGTGAEHLFEGYI